MKKFKIPAIVFGGGMNGLAVVRNLGRNGVTVYCVGETKEPATYSRFCKQHFRIPNVQKDVSILRKFLKKNRKLEGSVLFPTGDSYSLLLSELKDELEGSYKVPLPSNEIVRTLVDKKKFYHSLSDFGVPHPVTYFPESPQDIRGTSKALKYPVFVKPAMSQEFYAKFNTKGFVANSANELMRYYLLAIEHKTDVIFQEVVPGLAAKNVYGIEGYLDDNSNVASIFAYLRLRGWPPVFGNTCLRESISIENAIIPYTITKNYLQHIKYHGLMEAEWKKDPRDGVFKLLEINARQSMQSSLPARCGINFMLVAYLDAIGEKTKFSDSYEQGIKWINSVDDLKSAIETHTPIAEWISSLKNVREWSYFATDDFLPWIVSSLIIARKRIKKLKYQSN